MNKYLRLLVAHWSTAFQYRGDFYAWGFATSMVPLMALALWYAIALSSSGPLTPAETLAYFIPVLFLNNIIHGPDGYLFGSDVLQGGYVQHMIKPYVIWIGYFLKGLAVRTVFSFIYVLPLLALLLFFPQVFAGLDLSPANSLLAVASVALGVGVYFTFEMLLACTAFWLEESHEIRRFRHVIGSLAAGILLPYTIMPDGMRTVLSYLPFRYMLSAPVEILSGQVAGMETGTLIGLQVVWFVVGALLLAVAWRAGERRYVMPTQ